MEMILQTNKMSRLHAEFGQVSMRLCLVIWLKKADVELLGLQSGGSAAYTGLAVLVPA